MIKTSRISKVFGLSLAALGIVVVGGLTDVLAQGRDPFQKPGYAQPKPVAGRPGMKVDKDGKPVVDDWGVPSIEQRIDYYKRVRAAAAANNAAIPKVTSVLTLNEMAVTGIFRTPRGYAAMVEATPIKLSYTIYPGEKFFDGQLVAVEENNLVFRRVTKTGKDKFVSSVMNMPLRKYSDREQIEGTAPTTDTMASNRPGSSSSPSGDKPEAPKAIVSPVDEMNTQKVSEPVNKDKKPAVKKPAKIARNN